MSTGAAGGADDRTTSLPHHVTGMTDTYELRDSDQARRFLAQGLWWQRVLHPSAGTVRQVLEWALEAAAAGQPLPPVGFVADLGHYAFGLDWELRPGRDLPAVPALPIN